MTKKSNRTLRHIIIILIAIVALVVAFFLPYVAYIYESFQLSDYDIHYADDPVYISSDKVSLIEKLDCIKDMYNSGSYIFINQDNADDYQLKNSPGQIKEKAISSIVNLFTDSEMENVLSFDEDNSMVDSSQYQYQSQQPLLFIRSKDRSVFAVWSVTFYIPKYGYMEMLLDDETGKILGLYCDKSFLRSDINELIDNNLLGVYLSAYYEMDYFTDRVLVNNPEELRVVYTFQESLNRADSPKVNIELDVSKKKETGAKLFINLFQDEYYNLYED